MRHLASCLVLLLPGITLSIVDACGGHQVGTADASRETAERDAQGEGSLAQDPEGPADPSKLQPLTQSCCLPNSSCSKLEAVQCT